MKSKKKIQLLIGGILLLLFVCYKLALQNTLDVKGEYNRLIASTESLKDTPKRLSLLHQKENYFDSILNQMDLGDTSMQNNLLRVLNEEGEKNNLKVIDFNQPHVFSSDGNELYTYSFVLNGNYNNILKTIYTLEQLGNFGDVVHVNFEKKKNYRTQRNSLTAKVLIQQLK